MCSPSQVILNSIDVHLERKPLSTGDGAKQLDLGIDGIFYIKFPKRGSHALIDFED